MTNNSQLSHAFRSLSVRRLGQRAAWFSLWTLAGIFVLTYLAIFFVFPTGNIVGRGFISEAGRWDVSGFVEVLSRPRTWRLVGQTLGLALAATIGSVLCSLPVAFVLYRRHFPGRMLARMLLAVPFVLPTVVVGVAFRTLFGARGYLGFLQLEGTAWVVVAALMFFNFPLVVRLVGNLWARLDSRPLAAAQALGAGPLRGFFTVTLPMLRPAIVAGGALTFLFCATSFGVVLILGQGRIGTIETEIYILTAQFVDLRSAAVLSILQLLVVVVCLAAATRFSGTVRITGVVAPPASVPRLSRVDVLPVLISLIVTGLLLFLPMLSLLMRSLRRAGEWTLANYADLGAEGASQALADSVLAAAGNSLQMAVVAAVVAISIGSVVALIVTRRPRRRWKRALLGGFDAAFMFPLGVSAVTVGFGFLVSLRFLPVEWRTSWWLVPIAQSIVAIPLVVRSIAPLLRQISPRQLEAAAVLGAGPLRSLRTIEGTLFARGCAAAAGLAVALSLGEFGATAFLARPENLTLPVAIFRLISRPGATEQGMAVAAAVLLGLIAAAAMTAAEYLQSGKRSIRR